MQWLSHSASSQSLSDCIAAMGTKDVDGDLALSYAEYLNLLVDLTISTVESTDSPCTPEYAADLILNDPSLFQAEFVQVACHCVDFTSTGNNNELVPECVCSNNNITDTAITSNNNEGTPTIALPTVYPGAYAVRVCDDISTQLFLLTADCMDLPPIYTPVVSPILSSAAPTPWKSVKVPDNIVPPQPNGGSFFPPADSLPTVRIDDDETESIPTAAPALQIIEATPTTLDIDNGVTVASTPAPSSGSVALEDDGTNRGSAVVEDDNSKNARRVMAIAIPILTVAAFAVFALLWSHRRQYPHFDSRGNGEPRTMKPPAYMEHTEEIATMGRGGATNGDGVEDRIEGYGNIGQYIKTQSLNPTTSSSCIVMEDTEISETMEEDEEYNDDDDHENLDCLLSTILDSPSSFQEIAHPHLNLVLPSGEETSSCMSTAGTRDLDVVALRSSISEGESSRSTPTATSKSGYVVKSLRKSDENATNSPVTEKNVSASSFQSHSSHSSLNIFEDTSIVSSFSDENGLATAAALSVDHSVKPKFSPPFVPSLAPSTDLVPYDSNKRNNVNDRKRREHQQESTNVSINNLGINESSNRNTSNGSVALVPAQPLSSRSPSKIPPSPRDSKKMGIVAWKSQADIADTGAMVPVVHPGTTLVSSGTTALPSPVKSLYFQ